MCEVLCNYCGNVANEHKQSGLYVVDEDHNVIADGISEWYCPTCGETTFSSQSNPD